MNKNNKTRDQPRKFNPLVEFEYRVIVKKIQGEHWYALQRRRWLLFLSIPLWWVQVPPIWQPTYEKAIALKPNNSIGGKR